MSNQALSLGSLSRSRSLHEQTYQALRAAILSGELGAGDRLVETQLAKALQVSRTPIREALRQLQREHLVVTDANGGLRVVRLTVEDAIHLYDCRIALERLSVVEACRQIDRAGLERLESVVAQAESSAEKPPHQLTNCQLLHIDQQFHRVLAECSRNPWLVSLLDQVFDQMSLLRIRTMQQNPGVLEIRGEHRRIYDAVAGGDEEGAIGAIVEHLSASKERVIREIERIEPRSSENLSLNNLLN
ncbi:GntR family transcriptional regulator [Pannus brasiliensis CCIBt3594]|uniref:GntR family transcriptional regulator n=1 Tax=Pannus brasiliensis CCIBt3594 TaxID=1427578 RepID=A0AAW9QFZ1_9CHRO